MLGQVSLISIVFSCLCCCHIVHINYFFHVYQQNKFESKVRFRQASNCCKRVLEAAKLGSHDFWQIANSVLNKDKYALPHLFKGCRRCCCVHLIKQNCLLKTFLRTLILMAQASLYLFYLLELI